MKRRTMAAAIAVGLGWAQGAQAQQALYKTADAGDLNLLTSWSLVNGAQAPNPTSFTPSDTWYFNEVTMQGSRTVALGADITLGGLALDYVTANTDNNLVISAGNTLTLNGATLYGNGAHLSGGAYNNTGILLNRGAGGSVTINPGVALGAAQTWVTGRTAAGPALTVNGPIALSGFNLNLNMVGNAAVINTFSGAIGGSGRIAKYGAATLVVSGDNSAFTGGFQLGPTAGAANVGVVVAGHAHAFGTGTVIGRGTQLRSSVAGLTITNDFTVGAGGFRLGGTNAFVLSGLIALDNASRTIANYGTATVTLGRIDLGAGTGATAAFDNASGGGSGAPIIVNGAISGSGNVACSSTANTTLNGANTYTGTTTLSGGRLNLNGSLDAASAVTISGGTISGTGTVNGTVAMSGGSIALAGGAAVNGLTFAQGVTFSGAPTMTFDTPPMSGAVYDVFTYGAGTVVEGYLLTASCRGTLSDDMANAKYIFTAGEYGATRTWNTADGVWDIGMTPNWQESDQLFYNGDVAVFGEPAWPCVVTLSGRLAPTSVTVDNSMNEYTFLGTAGSADITGPASLTKNNTGRLILSTIQTYTGGTTVNGGTLRLTASSGGTGTIRGTLTINSNATVEVGGVDVLGYSSGNDSVKVLNINGGTFDQTMTRNETLGSCAVNMTGGFITGTGGAGAILDFFGGASTLNTLPSADPATISIPQIRLRQNDTAFTVADGAAAADLAIGSAIIKGAEGNGALIKNGAGTMVLSGNNTYTGNTTINGGVLELDGTGKLYNGGYNNSAGVTVNTGATWRMPDYSYEGVGQLADYAARRVINGGTIEVTGGGHSSGQDFTVMAAGGTFRYDPADDTETLLLRGNTNPSDITLNGTLIFDAVGHITVGPDPAIPASDGVIAGTGGLTKTGAGTLTLAGANTYGGPTTVSNGTLVVHGSVAGDVWVAAGAVLGGTGTVGSVTWDGGGAFQTGDTNLNVTGTLTLTSNGTPFVVNLPAGFDPDVQQSWVLMRAAGGISGFHPNQFAVNGAGSGTAVVSQGAAGELIVTYLPSGTVVLSLADIRRAGSTCEVTVNSSGAADVVLEMSPDLLTPDWQPVTTQSVSGAAIFVDPAATNPASFYRARVK